jgi:4-hydroxy-tetrahydrodipicolinate reductase
MASTRVTLVGAAGRMGQALTRTLPEFPRLTLVAAVASPGHAALGQDVGTCAGTAVAGVRLTDDLAAAIRAADVVIDFSAAAALPATLAACEACGCGLVVGTTGYDEGTAALFDAAALRVPLLVAANTSLALNVLLTLVRQAAAALPPGYDIEIVETHHRHKIDAPSGTALALGRAASAGRRQSLPPAPPLTGAAPGPRAEGSIGFAVARGGDVVGEHEVRFLGPGEQLRLGHIATDRHIFARGALTAAAWLAGRAPGRYEMGDVLSLKSAT